MRRPRRARHRGQSLIEMAMMMPMIVLIALGGTDLAVAYGFADQAAGAARAGMRAGIQGTEFPIGDSVRSEPDRVIANNAANWGNEAQNGSNDRCDSVSTGTMCGAANGCSAADFIAGQIMCFAIRTCTLDTTSYRCTGTPGAWGSRPVPVAGTSNPPMGLEVVVVYRYVPKTPAITQLTGNGSAFYLTETSYGLQLY